MKTMTSDFLLICIGDIDPAFIENAEHRVKPTSQRVKKIHVHKWIAAAACILLCGFSIWSGVRLFYHSPPSPQPSVPHFSLDGRDFTFFGRIGVDTEKLPEGYVKYGVVAPLDGNTAVIGDTIFVHPQKPDAVYVYTDLFAGEGNFRYLLFVTQELMKPMVSFNGKLYYQTDVVYYSPLEQDANYSLAGAIQKIAVDIIPSEELQCNIPSAAGCNVYASDKIPDVIYLEQFDESGYFYIELKIR